MASEDTSQVPPEISAEQHAGIETRSVYTCSRCGEQFATLVDYEMHWWVNESQEGDDD